MRTQKISKKKPAPRPKAATRAKKNGRSAQEEGMRTLLSNIQPGTWLVINDKLGPRHAVYARLTRAGKGYDVFVDLPKGSDFTRVIIPVSDVITIAKEGNVPAVSENAWRKLACEAVAAYAELAHTIEDDDDRDSAISSAAQLERRMKILAGQLELFK